MKARISVLTLGVADLEKAVAFYQKLGLATEGIVGKEFEYGAVAFFDLQNGLKLALWPRKSISHDTGIVSPNPSPLEFTIGHNVSSNDEVDAVMQLAQKAGATIYQTRSRYLLGWLFGLFSRP